MNIFQQIPNDPSGGTFLVDSDDENDTAEKSQNLQNPKETCSKDQVFIIFTLTELFLKELSLAKVLEANIDNYFNVSLLKSNQVKIKFIGGLNLSGNYH